MSAPLSCRPPGPVCVLGTRPCQAICHLPSLQLVPLASPLAMTMPLPCSILFIKSLASAPLHDMMTSCPVVNLLVFLSSTINSRVSVKLCTTQGHILHLPQPIPFLGTQTPATLHVAACPAPHHHYTITAATQTLSASTKSVPCIVGSPQSKQPLHSKTATAPRTVGLESEHHLASCCLSSGPAACLCSSWPVATAAPGGAAAAAAGTSPGRPQSCPRRCCCGWL